MTTFVLVPGAFLGAWAWSEVAATLTAAGHEVHPVTLTGLGERADDAPASTIGLTTHVDDVLRVLQDEDLREVTLVVHSYAGAVGGVVVDRAPERLARVVYLATQPLACGQSLFDLVGADAEQQMRALAAAAGDPDRLPVIDDEWLALLYPAHGMTGAALTRFRSLATPHPLRPHAEKADLTGAGDVVPRELLWCAGDGPVPLPPGTPGWTVRELPTGHWPMLTHPDLLAEALSTPI